MIDRLPKDASSLLMRNSDPVSWFIVVMVTEKDECVMAYFHIVLI